MNTPVRITLFFEKHLLNERLHDFFMQQPGSIVAGIFHENQQVVRDIRCTEPSIAIVQRGLLCRGLEKKLQYIFPNLIIDTWTNTLPDYNKMNYLIEKAGARVDSDFIVDKDCMEMEDVNVFHRRNDYQLTLRESSVLRLLVNGYSYQMICSELFISYETVRSHVKNIYSKLHTNRISEVVAKAIKEELVE